MASDLTEGGRILDPGTAVRRSRYLVSHWERDTHVVHNYASGRRFELDHEIDGLLLGRLERWTPVGQLLDGLEQRFPSAPERLSRMVDATLIEASNRPPVETDAELERWADWNPAAAWFHFATKDAVTVDSREARELTPVVATDFACPDHLKRYPNDGHLTLPTPSCAGDLGEALRTRRTWRRFGDEPVTIGDVSTLLGTTWGIQGWMSVDSGYTMPLKSSPSGGARHSIEVYLLAQRVEGLAQGTYHYCPDRHGLTPLDTAAPAVPALVRQTTFHEAPALFVMTSVFERVQWRYRQPRAYRVILIEAGHLGQTFALVATALGLAPFTTASFSDSNIEGHLGLRGAREAPIYIAGVGTRPDGTSWAPYEWTEQVPPIAPPSSADRPSDE